MSTGLILLISAVAMVVSLVAGRASRRLWLAATLLGATAWAGASLVVLSGGADWDWWSEISLGGEPLHLHLDGISAFFLVLLSVVGGAASIYACEYWADEAHPRSARSGRVWWSGLLLSLMLVLLCSNGLHFLIAWELFALCAYFLIALDRRQPEVRSAGWLYLGCSHAATLSLFAFFTLLAVRTGGWDLHSMRGRADLAPLFWLALFGFGLKAGLFPLHIWLPSAHANAPSHVSAVLSGVTIKMGIYGIVRFSAWLPVPAGVGWTVAGLGVVSAVLGVVFALGQHDLKRLLAYHSVENIGIILIGIGFALVAASRPDAAWGGLALAGGLLHVWNHGLFKGLLFLGAGSVLHATGTREMSRLGGLWRAMPWTATLFGIGAAAISGLPPLNGFVSEWLVYLGLFDSALAHDGAAWAAVLAAIGLAATGGLALACFVKVCGVVFLGAPRSELAARARECGAGMRGAMVALAAACVAIGVAPVLFWPVVARVVEVWQPAWAMRDAPAPLAALGVFHTVLALSAVAAGWWLWRRVRRAALRRAATWDCGYAAPSPRMQYTAGSFAATITEWFARVMCQERHDERPVKVLADAARFDEHTLETVLERVIAPASRIVVAAAHLARRLQHGRAQSYLLYLLLSIAALAVLALVG